LLLYDVEKKIYLTHRQ